MGEADPQVLTGRQVLSVSRSRNEVTVRSRTVEGVDTNQEVKNPSDEELSDTFDELILACDAANALKILGRGATWLERKVLGQRQSMGSGKTVVRA